MSTHRERNYDFGLFGGGLGKSRVDKLSKNNLSVVESMNYM